jgi:hypothetical protein
LPSAEEMAAYSLPEVQEEPAKKQELMPPPAIIPPKKKAEKPNTNTGKNGFVVRSETFLKTELEE